VVPHGLTLTFDFHTQEIAFSDIMGSVRANNDGFQPIKELDDRSRGLPGQNSPGCLLSFVFVAVFLSSFGDRERIAKLDDALEMGGVAGRQLRRDDRYGENAIGFRLGRYRGLEFGATLHGVGNPEAYVEGAIVRFGPLARGAGARAVVNALDRLAGDYEGQLATARRDIKPGSVPLENVIDRVKSTDFVLRGRIDDGRMTRSRTRMSATWHGLVAEDSGRIMGIARGGFRRSRPAQHGEQGPLAQRLARHSVGLECCHNLGPVILLAP
jgi:hypothetical protein